MSLTHIDKKGSVNMVDVGDKEISKRVAIAYGRIKLSEKVISLIKEDGLKKGNVLEIAKVGGIFGAKNTSNIIPLTHPLPLEKIAIEFFMEENFIHCFSFAKTHYKTGIEMEAIFSVLSALSTIYDMVKAEERGAVIEKVALLYKSGGKSGTFVNKEIEDFRIIKGKNFVFKGKKIFKEMD